MALSKTVLFTWQGPNRVCAASTPSVTCWKIWDKVWICSEWIYNCTPPWPKPLLCEWDGILEQSVGKLLLLFMELASLSSESGSDRIWLRGVHCGQFVVIGGSGSIPVQDCATLSAARTDQHMCEPTHEYSMLQLLECQVFHKLRLKDKRSCCEHIPSDFEYNPKKPYGKRSFRQIRWKHHSATTMLRVSIRTLWGPTHMS